MHQPAKLKSLGLVYFGLAFTVSAVLSMVALMILRPLLGELPRAVAIALMLTPAVVGVAYGLRVSYLGVRDNLRLGGAFRRGLGLAARDDDHWPTG